MSTYRPLRFEYLLSSDTPPNNKKIHLIQRHQGRLEPLILNPYQGSGSRLGVPGSSSTLKRPSRGPK